MDVYPIIHPEYNLITLASLFEDIITYLSCRPQAVTGATNHFRKNRPEIA